MIPKLESKGEQTTGLVPPRICSFLYDRHVSSQPMEQSARQKPGANFLSGDGQYL